MELSAAARVCLGIPSSAGKKVPKLVFSVVCIRADCISGVCFSVVSHGAFFLFQNILVIKLKPCGINFNTRDSETQVDNSNTPILMYFKFLDFRRKVLFLFNYFSILMSSLMNIYRAESKSAG